MTRLPGCVLRMAGVIVNRANLVHSPHQLLFTREVVQKGTILILYEVEENTAKEINDIIDYAINGKFSKECADAFRAVGAIPIGEQKTLIVTENVIKSEINDKTWSTGNFAKQVRGGLAANPTTNDLSSKGFIGVTNRAITKEDDYFSVIIIHSFIHSGGIPGKDDKTFNEKFWSVPAHDLRYLGEKYKNILKYCTKEGKSKGLGQDPL